MEYLLLEAAGRIMTLLILLLLFRVWGRVSPWMENIVIRMIVADGIKFAQKVYGHLEGHIRLQEAYMAISKRLERWKIYLTPDEIRVFIESILLELQAKYKDEWFKLSSKT